MGRGCGAGLEVRFRGSEWCRGAADFGLGSSVGAWAVSYASAVPILPPKNPPPPRHLSPLPHAHSPAFVLPHALAGGLVLVAEMVVLRVIPAGAKRRLPFALFLLSGLDAFLDGARGLAAVVAGRSAALCIGGDSGCEEGEGEEEVSGVVVHLSRLLQSQMRIVLV